MPIHLHILQASGQLTVLEEKIRLSVETAVKEIEKKISIPLIDVVVDDNTREVIPEVGVGGLAPTAHLLYIHINLETKGLEEKLDSEIKSVVAHELHHCARWSATGYGTTLLEALISEGLADHFDREVNSGGPKQWSIAVSGEELKKIQERASEEFFCETYNHNAWFFGSEEKLIPRWAGYSLGYYIVGEYLAKTGKKPSELVNEDARTFL